VSLPRIPSFSGAKPKNLHVVTIEECTACKLEKKRDFRAGDYITKISGTCEGCKNPMMITLIYGEKEAGVKGRS
jgi:hypothetical protein